METIIAIVTITFTLMSNVDAPKYLVFLAEPYADLTMHITDLGALTPGAVATPRQYRPPASWMWWGGDWLTWTALPRRGILHGAYKNKNGTASMMLVL